jgi:hypothetical protein
LKHACNAIKIPQACSPALFRICANISMAQCRGEEIGGAHHGRAGPAIRDFVLQSLRLQSLRFTRPRFAWNFEVNAGDKRGHDEPSNLIPL